MSKDKNLVQNFVANRINELRLEGKSQKMIAADARYPNPNMLTMIKQGTSKVAFDRVLDLERALEVRKGTLLRLMLLENFGNEVFEAIKDELCEDLSKLEWELVQTIRSEVSNPTFDNRAKRVLIAALQQ